MFKIFAFLLAVYNVFSYLKVQVAYVREGGEKNAAANGVGAFDKPWGLMSSAISSSASSQPDLLKVLVQNGNFQSNSNGSISLGINTDYEVIGSVDGEITTEKTKMEDGATEDTTFDLDCASTTHSFGGTGEFMTITNMQTFSIRRMRITSTVSTGSIFSVKLGHLIARKIYFSGDGRPISIDYVHGSVSLFYCYFVGSDKASLGFIYAIGGQNVGIVQCRFLNTTANNAGNLSPLHFNNVTNLTIQSCKFSSLFADGPLSEGGAMHINNPRRVVLMSCSFDKCRSKMSGGGLMISNIDCDLFTLIFVSCVFVENSAGNTFGHQIAFFYQWDMCTTQLTGMYKGTTGLGGAQIYGLYSLGPQILNNLLSENNVTAYNVGVAPDGTCNTVDYIDPGAGSNVKPPKKPGDNTTAEAGRQLSTILLVFLIIITVVVAIVGVLVCIYLVVTMIQGLNKPARVLTKDLNETEAEAYYNQIDGYEIEQVAHDEDGVTIIGEEEHVQKGGSKWAKKWAAIANRANKKSKFGVDGSVDPKGGKDEDGPNPDDLTSSLSTVTKKDKKKSSKKEKSGWSSGYSEYDADYSNYSGYGSSASGYGSSASGYGSSASGYGSNASGYGSSASGYSDASGYGSSASGYGSNASGYGSNASGYGSNASGYGSSASGYSDASGYGSNASGYGSNASGYGSNASGYGSNVSGYGSNASGYGSNPSGYSDPSGYSGAGSSAPSGYGSDASGYGSAASGYSGSDYSDASKSGYTDASKSKSKRSNSKASKHSKSRRSESPSDASSQASSSSKSKRSHATKTKKSHK